MTPRILKGVANVAELVEDIPRGTMKGPTRRTPFSRAMSQARTRVAGGRPAGAHDETRPFVAHLVKFQSGIHDGLLKRHVVPRGAVAHEPPRPLVNRLVRIHTGLSLDANCGSPARRSPPQR